MVVGAVFLVTLITINALRDHLLTVSSLFGTIFENKTESYLDKGDATVDGYDVSLQRSLIQGVINNGFFLLLFAYALKKRTSLFMKGLFNIFATSMLLLFMTLPFSLTLARVYNSYNLVSIILIGYAFSCLNKNNVGIYYLLFFAYICVRFSMQTFFGGYSECFVPYKSILW